jgi:RNA polymerase sigma-70 factor, ECF subfamily
VTDPAWLDAALASARPQAVGALLRYFRDLDVAEEAFQNASLRALEAWPRNGPPRDPAAWLIFAGRNVGIDAARRARKQRELVNDEDVVDDANRADDLVEHLDTADYRDDILRLLFICCHPDLPASQQLAVALRIVSGLTVKQIARAFLVSEAAMEQRITRAKTRIARADVPFEAPGPIERAERIGVVAAAIYLVFNEGYSTSSEQAARAELCDEAIRLARLLLRMYTDEPELMGLMALMLLTHARTPARFDPDGGIVLLENQDRTRWDREMIGEGIALLDKAMRHRQPGPYQVQAAIAALHARAPRAEDTDWAEIELLYATLERLQPSPVVTLNRAVAVAKVRGAAEALAMIEPLAAQLDGYFHFFGLRGALLLQLGQPGEARASFQQAMGLARSPVEATHIRQHLDGLIAEGQENLRDRCRNASRSFVVGSKEQTMSKITTFLTYSEAAEEAAKLYVSIFKNSKITRISRYPDVDVAPSKGGVMTVEFELDGKPFVALNGGPHFHFSEGISLSVECQTQEEVDTYSAKLIEGGGQQGPCGWLKDRFGVSWQINPKILGELLAGPDGAKAQRVMQAMLKMTKIDIAALEKAAAQR